MLWKVLVNSFAGLIRSLRIIFHQLAGLVFLLLGLSAAMASWLEYRQYTPWVASTVFRFYVTAGFALLLLGFAVASFWRARGLRKR